MREETLAQLIERLGETDKDLDAIYEIAKRWLVKQGWTHSAASPVVYAEMKRQLS